jgi:hypothetical protein
VEVGDKRKDTFEALGAYKRRFFSSKVSNSKFPPFFFLFFLSFCLLAYKRCYFNSKVSLNTIEKETFEVLHPEP